MNSLPPPTPHVPSKAEWVQWRHSPAGEWTYGWLQEYFQNLSQELILEGTINTDSVESTALSTIKAITRANTIYEIGKVANYEYICNMLNIPLPDKEEHEEE